MLYRPSGNKNCTVWSVIMCTMTALLSNDTHCTDNCSDIMNAWSLSQTPCWDQAHSPAYCCFVFWADSVLTHAHVRSRPVLGCEQLYLERTGHELGTASLIWTSSSFLICHTEKHTDTRMTGNTNTPPERHLDVASGSNLALLECRDCDQGISHLTAHAL